MLSKISTYCFQYSRSAPFFFARAANERSRHSLKLKKKLRICDESDDIEKKSKTIYHIRIIS